MAKTRTAKQLLALFDRHPNTPATRKELAEVLRLLLDDGAGNDRRARAAYGAADAALYVANYGGR